MSNPYLQGIAATALGYGVQVTSASNPALNGLYPCDQNTLIQQLYPALYVQANNAFPGSATSRTMIDMNGLPHVFTSPAAFISLVFAIANYVDELYQIISGASAATALPSPSISIP